MAQELCISFNKLHKGKSSKWLYYILVLVIVLVLVVRKYNKNNSEEVVSQNINKSTKPTNGDEMEEAGMENFRANTRGVPNNVFSSNWPYPPNPLEKYRFCGNDGFCNPGHECSDKLFGAMFPPVCNCYQLTKKDLQK